MVKVYLKKLMFQTSAFIDLLLLFLKKLKCQSFALYFFKLILAAPFLHHAVREQINKIFIKMRLTMFFEVLILSVF